jgi:hypothetical protein
MMRKPLHQFHIVTVSPWPFFATITAFTALVGAVRYIHGHRGGTFLLLAGLFTMILVMVCWWRDVVREASYQNVHTRKVQRNHALGVGFFIFTEVMFFFGFFFAFFYLSLYPAIDIGGQ